MPTRRVTPPAQTRLIFGLDASSRVKNAASATPRQDSLTASSDASTPRVEPLAPPAILSVTECNQKAKAMLERNFTDIDVEGEISNFRPDRSGHLWFALKDGGGVLSAVMFRREAQKLLRPLADGAQVVATGTLTIYPATGRYQLVIKRIRLAGAGALQAAFEELRKKLAEEGLFASAHKRRLPLVPSRVAVVTSAQGAVLQDIMKVGLRRWPRAQILVVPVRVQGPECAAEVARAIGRVGSLAKSLQIDVLIVARGGGSLEDLWGFNDERVARALAACPIPTVSAIGHESDSTISDWVADVRAPTPSVAAELVFPERAIWVQGLHAFGARLTQGLTRSVSRARLRLRAARAQLGDGKRALWPEKQRLATLEHRLELSHRRQVRAGRLRLQALERRLMARDPKAELLALRARLQAVRARLVQRSTLFVGERRSRLERGRMQLLALSPLLVLGRGYSITLSERGEAVRDAAVLRPGEQVRLRFASGACDASVLPSQQGGPSDS